ncbi:MAG: peptidoglycan-associated lipoprotein Pal [Pseudomonadales bacterium]|nr:peptidoglycan-associated lipoprotein Pal [Pseudomonadales bacterium]
MQSKKLVRISTVSALVVLLAACSSDGGVKDEVDTMGDSTPAATTTGYDASSKVEGSTVAASTEESKQAATMVSDLTTVYYFDFDSSAIRSDSTVSLDQLATYLKQDRAVSVVLGGHADERGTREYNMALGERRAKSVENYLLLEGVYRAQIETVSYGEEKPAVEGHDEASWQQNRRVEAKL